MKQPLVVFGIATFKGEPCLEFFNSYQDTLIHLAQSGIPSGRSMVPGDPYLSKARNRLAYEFLVNWPGATHLFFLDDDIGWQPEKVTEFVRRDLDIIVGAYPKKNDRGEFPVELDARDGALVERDGLFRVTLMPTGFCCIKREVLERLAAVSGQYRDTTDPRTEMWQWNLFENGWFLPDGTRPKQQGGVRGEFWGEDYYFGRRWRDMGGEIWLDPDIEFTHRGSKVWSGCIRASIEATKAKLAADAAAEQKEAAD